MSNVIFKIESSINQGSSLYVYDDYLEITAKGVMGFLARGLKGGKVIMFKDITSVQIKDSGLKQGYIQFSIAGGIESRGGLSSSYYDENSVVWSQIGGSSRNNEAHQIKEYIFKKKRELASSVNVSYQTANSDSDEIEKLWGLLQKGIISNDEFESKKKKILNI